MTPLELQSVDIVSDDTQSKTTLPTTNNTVPSRQLAARQAALAIFTVFTLVGANCSGTDDPGGVNVPDDDDSGGFEDDDDSGGFEDDDDSGDDDDSSSNEPIIGDSVDTNPTLFQDATNPTTFLGANLDLIPGGPATVDTDGDGTDDGLVYVAANIAVNSGSVTDVENTAAFVFPVSGNTNVVDLFAGNGGPGLYSAFEVAQGTSLTISTALPTSSSQIFVQVCNNVNGDLNGDGQVNVSDSPTAIANSATAGNTNPACNTIEVNGGPVDANTSLTTIPANSDGNVVLVAGAAYPN